MKLPGETSPITLAVWDAYKSAERQAPRRTHLGASEIGKDCTRAIWYSFRWAYRFEPSGRLLRLFKRGHREEEWIVNDLRRAGVEVLDLDPKTKKQWAWEDAALGGHFRGSGDGALRNVPGEDPDAWFLAEMKTSNNKAFASMVDSREGKGGVRRCRPQHFAQMQIYMGWSGLKRALYIVVNKDNDAYHFETVDFDQKIFDQLSERARSIVVAAQPPPKTGTSVESFGCKWCDAKDICHENKVAAVNCRTCAHLTAVIDEPGAQWLCERHGLYPTKMQAQRGCDDHLFIPDLIPYAAATDGGPGWVLYQIRKKDGSGAEFYNADSTSFPPGDAPRMSSKQIRAAAPEEFGENGRDVADWDLF